MADQAAGKQQEDTASPAAEGDRRFLVRSPLALRFAVAWQGLRSALGETLEKEVERGRAALWTPVLIAIGILLYFGLPREPSLAALLAIAIGTVVVTTMSRRRAAMFRLWFALAAILVGLTVMKLRTEMVSTPVLAEEQVGDLTGWVESIEQFSANVRRLVVRVETLEGVEPAATPRKVRITVRAKFDGVRVGSAIDGLVSLQPPPGPVMPGSYDFGRALYYSGIGVSGFSYGAPEIIDLGGVPSAIAWKVPIEAFRGAVGARIEAALPGETGQIANALITGDRGGISEEATEALRRSGLGHILTIFGLHMALVAGAVFAFLRGLFALSSSLALRRPIKKWAAVGALAHCCLLSCALRGQRGDAAILHHVGGDVGGDTARSAGLQRP